MSVELKIPTKFVPAKISEANLHGFSDTILNEIEETYQRIKTATFAQASKTGPSVTAIFGSHGSGVRTLMKSLKSESDVRPVNLNAERFITALPSYVNGNAGIVYGYGGIDATDLLRAGKYMHDRMMEEALNEGLHVVVTKRGRTAGGVELLKAFNDAGIALHTVILQAPLELKIKSGTHIADTAVSHEQIEAEHKSMTENMVSFAGQSQDHLSIYFRTMEQENGKLTSLLPVASGDADSFSIYNEDLAHDFDRYFKGNKVSVEGLMRTGNRTQVARPQHDRMVSGFELSFK